MEIWKDIKWYEWLYQISNKSSIKNYKGKILKIFKNKWWYSRIWLSKNSQRIKFIVSRLMWQAFLWLDINDLKICVLHKKETLINWFLDNSLDNLFLGTKKDNSIDCVKKWRHSKPSLWKFWKNNPHSKKVNQYTKELKLIKIWNSLSDIERTLWISTWTISDCCKWIRRKTAKWFIWKYN